MKISSTAAQTITSRFADVATKLKLIGTITNGSGTTAYASDVLSSGVFVTNSSSFSLDEELIFTINFPSGTIEISIDSAQLISSDDQVLATADIDGDVKYSGAGSFTLTDFTILFNFDFI
jgi:hypothetical protein